jgi:DNA-binding transcriptional LysR family regulator
MSTNSTNFRTLDLNLLRVFDVVMVERNVTRAASRLAMTQPAVSNALRRLREATNEELFLPGAQGVTPTAHAQALWPVVRESLARLQQAFAPRTFDPRAERRHFTLAMADATAALFVPVLVEAIKAEQAQVDWCVLPLSTRDPRSLLEQGQADAAIGFFPAVQAALDAEGDATTFALEALYGSEYACAMRLGHPLAAPGALTLDAYCAADHLRVSFSGRNRGYVDQALARLGRTRRVMVTVANFFTAGMAVHQSDLLTVLPRSFVPATGFAAQLAQLPLPFELPGIAIGLLWHRRHQQDAAQEWLRQTLRLAAQQVASGTQSRSNPKMPGRDTTKPDGLPQREPQ